MIESPTRTERTAPGGVAVQRFVRGHNHVTLYLGDCLEIAPTLAGVAALRAEAAKQAKCLREQSAECFPEENGQKHFARLIMEGVADELDAAFNPPNVELSRAGERK